MDYIEKLFNTKIKYSEWGKETCLPIFFSAEYAIKKACFKNIYMLFLYPKYELPALTALKKHIEKIQSCENLPVVLILNSLTPKLRRYLLRADIPFIAANTQIYLPFLGIALAERYTAAGKELKKLLPSAQLLLLYIIYNKISVCSITAAAKALNFSEMTISKAMRQLLQTKIFYIKKDGLKKLLAADYSGKEIFDKAQPFLINPVKKTVYIDAEDKTPAMPSAGYSALAEHSMLNPPGIKCYAAFKEPANSTAILVDSMQYELEIWKYDPAVLAKANSVDVLSLALTYKNNEDPRTEAAVEEMLKTFWEEY